MEPGLWWIVTGVVLIVAEFFLTSFVVIFFGVAAVLTGLLLFIGLPDGAGIPYAVFSALTVGMLLVLRRRCQAWFSGASFAAGARNRDDDFLDKEAEVASGFAEGDRFGESFRGKVNFRGTRWDAFSLEALSLGDRVVIHAREGSTLQVRRP